VNIIILGHAGFLVDCEKDAILCDPWFSPYGAYAAAWFPFPANDSIDLESLERSTHLYISHWHEDHLDEWFLNTRSEQFKHSVTVIIPKFQYPRLKDVIENCGYNNILEIEDEYTTPNGSRIYIQRDENPLYSDSSITIGSGNQVFVNSNDCKLTIGQEEEILRRFGNVTVYAAQFSGATFHPTCYDYPAEKKIEMSRVRREAKFQRIVSSMERLNASAYIPSAGPACFLSDDLFPLNLNPETVFSSNSDFYSWLKNNVQRSWLFTEMIPGEIFDANALSEKRASFNFETEAYLRKYAENRQYSIRERIAQFYHPMDDLLGEAKKHFRSKLDDVPSLARKANVMLEFHLGKSSFFVDTQHGRISDVPPEKKEQQHYRIELSDFWMRAILGGKIRWEDLILSFRFKISRTPDVYNEAFIAFLQLDTTAEREDYIRHLDLLARRNRERIRRECDGRTIEHDRFCPHNCEDLTDAKIEEGMLTCPRHFWRFSIEDGRGLNNPGNIHVVEITD
jgi:UDP-MurNAc hydroxylase